MKECLAVVIDKWEVVGAIASTVNVLASLAVISFVAIQLKSSNHIAQAQLINEPKVQGLMNTPAMKPYMTSIVDLHQQWCEYRNKSKPPLMEFKKFSGDDIQEVQKNAI